MNDPANTSESEHRYYEQLYYDRLESDAKLCRELRAMLPQSGYRMSMTIGSVRIECLEPQKLFDLLISIRDGGAT